jgi:cellulose synthase/poly-beta-1,6-N-acetylglucosamine synthase-like glycosyltransferase
MRPGEPEVRVSVVIPAYRAWATLPTVLDALEPQIVDCPDRECILVVSSDERDAAEVERRWPWVHVIALRTRAFPGRARNIAVERARGAAIAFTDADSPPAIGWLDELERALLPGLDGVAGAVANGTPESLVGTAGHLLEFSEWLPHRGAAARHAATCNLLVRRPELERRRFREDLWPGEDTIFTFPIGSRGKLAFASAATVHHLNRTSFREFLRHQQRLGASFFQVCAAVPFPGRIFATRPLAPISGFARLATLARRVARHPRDASAALLYLPLVACGLAAWTVGLTRAAWAKSRQPSPEQRRGELRRSA